MIKAFSNYHNAAVISKRHELSSSVHINLKPVGDLRHPRFLHEKKQRQSG